MPNVRVDNLMHETLARLAPPPRAQTPHLPEPAEQTPDRSSSPAPIIYYQTEPDAFGVYRRYTRKPARDLRDENIADNRVDGPNIVPPVPGTRLYLDPARALGRLVRTGANNVRKWFYPFPNPTIPRLLHWQHTGTNLKSDRELTRLATLMQYPDFQPDHLSNFDVSREKRRLDALCFADEDGWLQDTVKISLPKERVHNTSEEAAPELSIEGVWHRRIVPTIKSIAQDSAAKEMHWVPFEQFQQHDGDTSERVIDEVYNSNAMLEEDARILAMPRNPDDADNVEYAIFPLLAYSDSTRLANFGTASLWPCYLYPGGLSKYVRAKPDSFAANHIAYIPSVLVSSLQIFEYHLLVFHTVTRYGSRHVQGEIRHSCEPRRTALPEDRTHAGGLAPSTGS